MLPPVRVADGGVEERVVRTVGGVGDIRYLRLASMRSRTVAERGRGRPDAGVRGGEREERRSGGGDLARPEEGGTPPLLLLLPRVASGRSN